MLCEVGLIHAAVNVPVGIKILQPAVGIEIGQVGIQQNLQAMLAPVGSVNRVGRSGPFKTRSWIQEQR